MTAVVALACVAVLEALLRLDPHPKALPFESTRTGTLADIVLRDRPRYDFLFLGSSQCATGVVPAVFTAEWQRLDATKVTAFNAGCNGAAVLAADELYHTVFSRIRAGTTVFFVGPVGWSARPQPDVVDSYGMRWLQGRLGPADDALMHLWLFRYRRQWRDPRFLFHALARHSWAGDLDRRIGPDGLGWQPGAGGFLRGADWASSPGIAEGIAADYADWQAVPEVVRSLDAVVAQARAAGSRVVLVVPPQPPRFSERLQDSARIWTAVGAALHGIADAHPGTCVVDLHDDPSLGNDDFADPYHVHADMAPRLTRDLAQAMHRALAELPQAP